VPGLIGLQIAAGLLAWLFDVMQALAHSNYQGLQICASFFAYGFLGLGILVFLIAFVRGSLKVIFFEVLFLGLVVWLTLPEIH
jgi:hypothetical protein